MAYTSTKLVNLIDPEVLTDYFDAKLIKNIVFAPLAVIDNRLQGKAGDTVKIPVYSYIGDAVDVAEGEDIAIASLTATSTPVKVKKAGKGVALTDEAVLSGYGDPVEETGNQLIKSVASKVDTDFVTTLKTAKLSYTNTAQTFTSDTIIDANVLFGEDLFGQKLLIVSPKQYASLLKDEAWIKTTDMGIEKLLTGVVGMIDGCQVLVSERIPETKSSVTNFIIKPGALGLLLKRDTMIESDRNIVNKSTIYTVDKHYATYIKDASKVLKIETTLAG